MKKSYIARIFMVLTLLTVLIAMTGCGGGNAGNELTDEQLLEMLEARGLEPGPTEEEEYMPVAAIDTSDWITVSSEFAYFTVSIPSTWSYAHKEDGNLSIFDSSSEIQFGIHVAYWDTQEYVEWILDSSLSWDYFLFDDGHLGHEVVYDNRLLWANNSSIWPRILLYLDHDGDTSIFTDNEDLILAIARSLTSALPNETDQDTAAVTQGSILDERLFGAWVQQGVPYWVILIRTFNLDGTGYWWGDGPGFEFIWWVDGNVLTMDARCEEFGDEWTDVFRYEIVGDTKTFTHDDGWQLVYMRESTASANYVPSQPGHVDRHFMRMEYLAFDTPSLNDVFRFPDQHMNSPMFLENFRVSAATINGRFDVVPRLAGGNLSATIDVSGLSGIANAMEGDIVTIYGRFTGLSSGIPQIKATHVVFNNMTPDPEEFLPLVIEMLNMHNDALHWEYSTQNEYLGNGRMNLVMMQLFGVVDRRSWFIYVTENRAPLRVDGFRVGFQLVDENGNRINERLAVGAFSDTVRLHRIWRIDTGLTVDIISETR